MRSHRQRDNGYRIFKMEKKLEKRAGVSQRDAFLRKFVLAKSENKPLTEEDNKSCGVDLSIQRLT